ncbi:MAG: phosphatase PAP2 family protein [Nitrospiraceae bacterium]|nr:phosphatase PAP2 family protein [Nitrospiraceae bacterium]
MTGATLLRARPADILNVLFLVFLTSLTVLFRDRLENPPLLIGLYSLMILLQAVTILIREKGRFPRLLHAFIFPTISILVVFDSLGRLVHPLNPHDIDPLLIRIDYRLFGCYPTVALERIMTPFLTDLLQLAYMSYYFIPISLGVVLYLRGRDEEFDRTLFFIMLCFYLSYIGYLLFPALGPRYTMAHLQNRGLEGLFLSGRIQHLLNSLEGIKRDAFPSGHTGIALTTLYLAFVYERRLFAVLLPLVAALVFSTVYCRYHYGIDVIGGVLLTVITIFMGEAVYGCRTKRIDTGR